MPEVFQSLTLPSHVGTNGKKHVTFVTKGQYPTTRAGNALDTFTLGQRFIDLSSGPLRGRVNIVHRVATRRAGLRFARSARLRSRGARGGQELY